MKLTVDHLHLLRQMRKRPVQLHAATARALKDLGLITVETTLTPLGSSRPTRVYWGSITNVGADLVRDRVGGDL